MTNAEGPTTPLPQPGWYPDYAGGTALRWWDGSQWTEHLSSPAPYTGAAVTARNTVPATTPVGNVFIWIIALLPIVSIALQLTIDYRAIGRAAVSGGYGHAGGSLAIYGNPGYVIAQLVGWVIFVAVVVLAYFDWRTLRGNGVERPFHWAWGFIGIVYVIGRSVVVHRRSGRGLAPLWVYLALTVVSLVVVGFEVSQMMSVIFDNLPVVPANA